jgi:hypothetical protein
MNLKQRINKSLPLNDCSNCKYAMKKSHTHHIGCSYFGSDLVKQLKLLHNPPVLKVTPKDEEELTIELVTLNPHGVNNGWAMWPFEFDPCWIKCKLPEKE